MSVEKVEAELGERVANASYGMDTVADSMTIEVGVGGLALVLAENARLREQVTSLQQRGTELIQENRVLQRKIDEWFGNGEES